MNSQNPAPKEQASGNDKETPEYSKSTVEGLKSIFEQNIVTRQPFVSCLTFDFFRGKPRKINCTSSSGLMLSKTQIRRLNPGLRRPKKG